MTVTILLIALAHGIPVFLAAKFWNSKPLITLAALVMCVVAVATGAAQYAVFDLISIGIVYFLCIGIVGDSPRIKHGHPPKQPEAEPAKPKSEEESWIGIIIGLIVIGVFIYAKSADKPAPSPTPIVQVPQQAITEPQSQPSERSKQSRTSSMHGITRGDRSTSDLRHCLNLPTNEEVMRCANLGR